MGHFTGERRKGMSKTRFEGKVVAVTGGARGLGLAISTLFADQGAQVAVGDIDFNGVAANATCTFELDVCKLESCIRFIRYVQEKLGGLDVLVNNAGIFRKAPSAETR